MGPPADLILDLAMRYKVDSFVETGTFQGGTTLWASQHFGSVITVENSKTIYDVALKRFEMTRNVQCLCGDSRSQLKTIVGNRSSPAIIWLDSHWCGGESYGETDQCPLLQELEILNSVSMQHLLFIDDARLFTSPPPLPNRVEEWPTIADVCRSLDSGKYQRYVVIFEDVIIAVPEHMKAAVAAWCQSVNTKEWQDYGERLKKTNAQRSIELLSDGLRYLTRAGKDFLRSRI